MRGPPSVGSGLESRTSDSSGRREIVDQHVEQARALARGQRAVGAAARAPGRRRGWRPRASARRAPPGNARASVAISPQSDRSGVEARLSVPSAIATPSSSSAGTSASRPPMWRFERGQSTTVAPASRASRRSSALGADHVNQQRRRRAVERAQRRQIADRRFSGRPRRRRRRPSPPARRARRRCRRGARRPRRRSSAMWMEVARSSAAAAAKIRRRRSGPTE